MLVWYMVAASFFMLLRGLVATVISLINTVFWMAVVFSTAGPMMLSGLYEARLDRRVVSGMLKAIKNGQDGGRERFYRRVGGLYVILVGNLEFGREMNIPGDGVGNEGERGEERKDSGKCVESEIVEFGTGDRGDVVERSVWDDINTLVKPRDLIEAEDADADARSRGRTLSKDFVEHLTKLQINYRKTTETRLKAMLDCQASFGAVIGAAVVFFVGSFLFSVVQNLTTIGDNDTSHALAFGMWWMIVPHVAIVSGCLLAGNNPNTLEVIICSVREPWNRQESTGKGWWRSWWQRYYSSVYVPVRMVERGMNKRLWVRRLVREYPLPKPGATPTQGVAEEEDELDIELDLWDWVIMSVIVVFLMGAPFVLAYLTSFFTPAMGLSCRAFTILLYFLFQVCYMAIWGWDFYTMTLTMLWRTTSEKLAQSTNRDIERNRRKSSTSSTSPSSKVPQPSPLIHKLLLGFVIFGSTFTSVFGTCFQLIGLYRNCLCYMPMKYWRSGDFSFGVSSNTADDILWAKRVWLPTGITSIALMVMTCYIGWWYQRHWRVQFREVVRLLLNPSMVEGCVVGNDGKEGGDGIPREQVL
ncbi:hypothetical protein HYALB_00010852 [Hymenoscyphus albidus]|uniref:Uncharacterized protein n=1 Tax=Hymenoscyphus albidus TaxID=595503 RepID=A0A9N9Q2F6_9HELO|nr:hypothetical protein HYALB_00010852 [Hymenoscyphus albidus]